MPTQSGDCTNGFGRFEWDDGQVYEGQWKDDRQHGKGQWTCPLEATNQVGMSDTKPATYFGDWCVVAAAGASWRTAVRLCPRVLTDTARRPFPTNLHNHYMYPSHTNSLTARPHCPRPTGRMAR